MLLQVWSPAAGTALSTWPCIGGSGQRWVLRGDGSLYNPGSQRCADVAAAAGIRATSLLRLADCGGQPSQRFTATEGNELRGNDGRCVDHSRTVRRVVQMAACDGADSQAWIFLPLPASTGDGGKGEADKAAVDKGTAGKAGTGKPATRAPARVR